MADSLATLADPTDFGNKPGDGPLRAGGQPGTPERDASRPSTRSPQSAAQQGALRLARDLWGGVDMLRLRAGNYLPKAPGEGPDNYRNRLARTAFFNAFRRTVDGLVGLVFRKDPKLGDDVPEAIRGDEDIRGGHWENIDNAGTHGDVFTRDIFQDALIAGHAAILVEFPQTTGDQTARAELTGELRPYWVPVRKDDIISWRTRVVSGKTMLTQVVLRESKYVDVGEFGTKEQTLYRVLRNEGGLVDWRLLEEDDGVIVQLEAGVYGNQTEIPLAEIVSSGRRSLFDSDPPLKDLAHMNVSHYQMWSDYNWSIHKTCVPFLFGAGIVEATDANGKKVPLTVGANSAVLVSEPQAKMGYVAHSGESLDNVKDALDDLKNDMGTIGISMLAPQKRAAETAEAKRMDKATADSALAVSARGLQDGLERALQFHANYMRLPTGGSIEINRDFEGMLMEAPVMQAFAQLVNAGFPPRAVLQALQAGGRIQEDEDLDALELEWMAGAAAADAMAAETKDDDAS